MGGCVSSDAKGEKGLSAHLTTQQLAVTAGYHADKERDFTTEPVPAAERPKLQKTLNEKIALFAALSEKEQEAVLDAVYVREVPEGDLLIVEGAQAGSSDEMYVVAYGEFEVLQKLKGVNIKVNQKGPGDIFGEVALFMNT